jgi:L-aspartate oxidase
MASNLLLECFVYGRSAALYITKQADNSKRQPSLPDWDESQVTHSDKDLIISHNWEEPRRFMWSYAGIVRTDKRLQRAYNRMQLFRREI